MADTTWTNPDDLGVAEASPNRLKFVIGGVVLAALIVALIYNAMQGSTQLYVTVNEFYEQPGKWADRDLRVAGWVVGDSIEYVQLDATSSRLEFDIVQDLDTPGQTLHIVAFNEPKPDLLQHQAQALVEGRYEDGLYVVNEGGLFLKCPTRYEELEAPVAEG